MRKLFTLTLALLASFSLWAATETVTKASADKADWVGTCATISNQVMTNSNSNDYVKMRTGNNSNRIVIAVNNGYKITGFSIQAYSNNSTTGVTIPMTSVTYDGGANLLAESIVFPISSSKPSSPQYNNTTNEATNNITLTFDNSNIITDKNAEGYSGGKNKQIMAIIKLTYEAVGPIDPTITFNDGVYTVGASALDLSTLFTSNSSGAVTYTVKTDGGTSAVINGTSFTASAAGTAVVTATQAAVTDTYNEKSVDANIVVTGQTCPSGVTISGQTDYMEGQTISLTAALAEGNGEITYNWYKGTDLATAKTAGSIGTGTNFSKANCVIGDANNYFCVATKANCDEAASSAYAVTVSGAPDYLLINQSTGEVNTTNFRTTCSSSNKDGGYDVNGTNFAKYIQLGGAFTTPVGVKETNKIISYDAKTKSVKVEAWIYNKASSSDYKFYISMIEEGTTTPTIKEFDAPRNSGTKVTWTFTPTKNATIYLTVGNNSNVFICQMGVTENGTNLLQGGQIGYSVRLDSCRLANNKNATPFVMDGISYLATSNSVNIWTTNNPVKLKTTTEYIKFTLPVRTKVSIKASGTYSITKSAEYSAGASMSGNQDVTLAADTWYICSNGSNTSFVSLSFNEPDAAYAVTYAVGSYNETPASVKAGEELPTHADAMTGEEITLASGDVLECAGADFAGWKANGVGDLLEAGDTYTMTAAPVEFVAQWTAHVAKYTVIYKDGDDELKRVLVNVGSAPDEYIPTKDFYTFASWSEDPSDFADTAEEGDEEVVTASWNPVYLTESIDFETGGSSVVDAVADYNIIASNAGSYDAGKEAENWAYKGWKIKSAGATVKFLVPANMYIKFKFGYLAAEGSVTISGDEEVKSVTGASKEQGNPLKYKTYEYQKNYDAIYTFTTGSADAAVIKAITMSSTPTSLDNTADEIKAVKFIENGQLFIRRGEKVYTITGEEVK